MKTKNHYPRSYRRGAILAALAGLTAFAAPAGAAFFESKLSADGRILSVAYKDLDGDRKIDPVVAFEKTEANGARGRKLRLFSPDGDGYKFARDLDVPSDVVAYSLGDFTGEGAAQVLYLTRNAAITLSLKDGSTKKIIDDHPFIFDTPMPSAFPFWDHALDLNGDGKLDLILADSTGFIVYLRDAGGALKRSGRVESEFEFATQGGESSAGAFTPGGSSETLDKRGRGSGDIEPSGGPPPAVAKGMGTTVNEPPIETYRALTRVVAGGANGDALPDLLAMNRDTLLAYVQKPGAGFGEKPDLKIPLGPQGLKYVWDGSRPGVAHGDIDGDKKTDFVVSEIDAKELTTKLRVYLWGDKGPGAEPNQILKIGGLGAEAELTDLNHDGALDIGLLTLRADKMLELSKTSSEEMEATYYAFVFDKGKKTFSRSPDVKEEFTIAVTGDTSGERARDFTHCQGDYNGDGVRDLLLFDNRGEIKIRFGKGGAGYSVGPVAFTHAIKSPRSIETLDLDGDGKSDLALRHGESVQILMSRAGDGGKP